MGFDTCEDCTLLKARFLTGLFCYKPCIEKDDETHSSAVPDYF